MAQPTSGRRQFGRDVARLRRLIKRLPDGIDGQILRVLHEEGPAIESYGLSAAPRRTGRLRAALRYRVLPRTLRAEWGLIGRKLNRDLFYARILEFGRKGGPAKRMTQRRLKGGGLSKKFRVNVRAIPADRYDFTAGRMRTWVSNRIRPKFERIFTEALRRVAGGA